jgi:hypothetical protein
MTLYDRDNFEYQGSGSVIPIFMEENTPQITATVTPPGRDPIEGKFLIDTGANSTVHLTRPFCEDNDLFDAFPKTFLYKGGFGVGGESSSTVARLDALTIGDLTFKAPPCALAHDAGGAHADPNTAGLIGGQILNRCTVIFDYERKRMILEPNVDFEEPIEENWSGLVLKTGGRGNFHHIIVARVLDGSPAEEAGIEEGDVITAADGTAAAALSTHRLWEMFMEVGRTIHLSLERDGKPLEVSVTMKRRV